MDLMLREGKGSISRRGNRRRQKSAPRSVAARLRAAALASNLDEQGWCGTRTLTRPILVYMAKATWRIPLLSMEKGLL